MKLIFRPKMQWTAFTEIVSSVTVLYSQTVTCFETTRHFACCDILMMTPHVPGVQVMFI